MVHVFLSISGRKCVGQMTHFQTLRHHFKIIFLLFVPQRQKCFGMVNVCYRIGSIVNALVAPRGEIPLPAMICYSSGPFLGAALCLLLPETSGIPLPDTVLDCEKQPRLHLQCLPFSR